MQEHTLIEIVPIEQIKQTILEKNVEAACKVINDNNVTKLDLSFSITEDHIETVIQVLRKCENIIHVGLRGCHITVKGAKLLADFLSDNKIIKFLDLSRNRLNSAGLKIIASFLDKNDTLTTLKLSEVLHDNDLTGIIELKEALKKNKTLLSLFFDGNVTAGWHTLYYNSYIAGWFVKLNSYGDQITALFCEVLRVNKTLKTLSLKDNGITDTGLEALTYLLTKENNTLLNLIFGNTDQSVEAVDFFKNIPNSFTFAGAEHLANLIKNNRTLRELSVARCRFGLTKQGVALIMSALSENRTLISVDFRYTPEADNWRGTRPRLLARALRDNHLLLEAYPSSKDVNELVLRNRDKAETLAKRLIDNNVSCYNLSEEDIKELKEYQAAVKEALQVKFEKTAEEVSALLAKYTTPQPSISSSNAVILLSLDGANQSIGFSNEQTVIQVKEKIENLATPLEKQEITIVKSDPTLAKVKTENEVTQENRIIFNNA